MTENTRVEIELQQEAAELFERYQRITGTTAEQYVGELVVKTLPTLRAIVEAMEEAATSDDPEKVMELFGRKMAQAMVQQRDAVSAAANG